MPKFSKKSKLKLKSCHPDLQLIFNEVVGTNRNHSSYLVVPVLRKALMLPTTYVMTKKSAGY